MKIGKQFRFEASHQLPYHLGQCHDLHGHSYLLEVEVEGEVQLTNPRNPESGMIVDFQRISDIVRIHILPEFDHKHLNKFIENPTAEAIVEWIVSALQAQIENSIAEERAVLNRVRLWETATSFAEWSRV